MRSWPLRCRRRSLPLVVAGSGVQGVLRLEDRTGHKSDGVLIGEPVVDALSVLAARHHPGETHLREVLRHRGRRLVDDLGEAIHRQLARLTQREDHPDPGRIRRKTSTATSTYSLSG